MSRSSRRGALLLEAVMAFFIFACAFLVLMVVLPGSARALRKAEARLLATHAARQHLEDTLAQGWDGMSGSGPQSSRALVLCTGGVTRTFTCSCTVTVSALSGTLKQVACTAQWRDGDVGLQTLSLQTLVTP